MVTLFCAVMSHLWMPGARRSVVRDEKARSVNGCCGTNCVGSKYWSTAPRFVVDWVGRSALENARGAPELNVVTQLTCQFATSRLTSGCDDVANLRPGPNGSSYNPCSTRRCGRSASEITFSGLASFGFR